MLELELMGDRLGRCSREACEAEGREEEGDRNGTGQRADGEVFCSRPIQAVVNVGPNHKSFRVI